MARTVAQNRPQLLVPKRSASPSPENFAVAFRASSGGAGEFTIAYEGPLAGRSEQEIYAHCGVWREGGGPWSEVRDIALRREAPGRCVGLLKLASGAPLRAIELAIRVGADVWDNGGRAPLGYYEWRVGQGGLVAV